MIALSKLLLLLRKNVKGIKFIETIRINVTFEYIRHTFVLKQEYSRMKSPFHHRL